MKPTLQDLEELAREAGKIVRAGYHARPGMQGDLAIEFKGVIDLVTDVDRRSEAYLLEEILRRFPDHRVVAEESGEVDGKDSSTWYIDPIDGTVNFAHGIPIFCISIGYAEDGLTRLGVIYEPMRDECFSAERGRGAWLNGEPIRVSNAKTLTESLLVTGFPYDIHTNPRNNLDNYAGFAVRTQGVRRLGSAALDLCYVASGRFDGYWEMYVYAWDLAAGALIAEEAGAVITNIAGSSDFFVSPYSIVAANPTIHAQMLDVLRMVEEKRGGR